MLAAYAAVTAATEAAEAAAETPDDGDHDDQRLRASIRFSDATVRYRPDGPPALDRASLVIPVRSTTAVVGPSGAGKTTLVDALLGLLPLSTGTVEIDGRALAGPTRPWRRRVAYVPQETFLFDGTVATNLRWARPGASDHDLWEALRLAAADGFVSALPDGLATSVGDGGRPRRAPVRRGAPAARPRPRPAAPSGRARARRGHQQPRRRQRGGGRRGSRPSPRHGHDRGRHPQPRHHPAGRPGGRARPRARGRGPGGGGRDLSPTARPGVGPPALRTTAGAGGDHAVDLRWAARRLALEVAAAGMLAELDALGVETILLKGPVTARRLYPGEFRSFVDVDLLVAPHGLPPLRDWLRRNGFRALVAGSSTFRRPGDGVTVDLHLTLPETSATPERTWRVLARHSVAFELHGRSVRALDDAAHACHLAIHAVQTGNRNPRPRADLDRAVARLPLPTWVRRSEE